jgi:hypothetical protein
MIELGLDRLRVAFHIHYSAKEYIPHAVALLQSGIVIAVTSPRLLARITLLKTYFLFIYRDYPVTGHHLPVWK